MDKTFSDALDPACRSDSFHAKTPSPADHRDGFGSVGLRLRQCRDRCPGDPRYAGATEKGFLLPNGWTLKPAGEHVPLADLPLNIVPTADNRHVLAATSGYNAHELSLIDLQERKVVDHQTVRQSWFGLARSPEGDRVWWSGGGGNVLHAFRLADRHLTRTSGPEPATTRLPEARATSHFRSGLAVDRRAQGALLARRRRAERSPRSISRRSRS